MWASHPSLPALEALWTKVLIALPPESSNQDDCTLQKSSGAYNDPIQWKVEGTDALRRELRRISSNDLVRFLLAHDGNVDAALNLAKSVAQWHAAVQPALVTLPQISTAVSQGLWRFGGWSKCGYPIVLAGSKGWRPGDYYSVDEYVRFTGYVMEVIRRSKMGAGVEKWMLVCEFEGFSWQYVRPLGMRCFMQLGFVIQEMNVERLAFVGMTNTGPLRHFWPVLRPFVKPRISPVMRWPEPSEQRAMLTTFIDASMLETRFGGDYQGYYPPFTGRWEEDTAGIPPPPYDPTAPDPSPESYQLWYGGNAK